MSFQTDDVAVIMKGEEWFAILARIQCLLEGKTKLESLDTLSPQGARAYNSGMGKLQQQILAAAARSPETPKRNRKKRDAPPQS